MNYSFTPRIGAQAVQWRAKGRCASCGAGAEVQRHDRGELVNRVARFTCPSCGAAVTFGQPELTVLEGRG